MDIKLLLSRIDLLCKENGVSQNQAFVQSGVKKDFANNMKNGSEPSNAKIIMLSEYFNVSTDYLLGQTDIRTPTETKIDDSDIKFALFNGAEGITDEMYEEVKRFAAYIKKTKTEETENKKV